jgi:predicted nucleic acid-binding protein
MGVLLLMDESCGRAFAEAWGLRVKGALHVILKALREELLDKDGAREAVLQLVEKGFRIEPRLLARILKEIESFDLQYKL